MAHKKKRHRRNPVQSPWIVEQIDKLANKLHPVVHGMIKRWSKQGVDVGTIDHMIKRAIEQFKEEWKKYD